MGDEREVAELKAQMVMLIDLVKEIKNDLNTNYVKNVQFQDLKDRVEKVENAPGKWLSTMIAIVGALVALLAYFKH